MKGWIRRRAGQGSTRFVERVESLGHGRRRSLKDGTSVTGERIGVLFMQSQEFFGADSQIHASVMRHLSRDDFAVHCAIPAAACPAADVAASIPDVQLRVTDFGPTTEGVTRIRMLIALVREGLPAIWSLVTLARYVRGHRIRIIHCTEKPRDTIPGYVVARLGGAKLVVHVHVKAETWLRPTVRRVMHHADALIGVSEFVAESIRELVGPGADVWAVPNGLEIENWSDPEFDGGSLRAELGIAPGAPVVVSASRLFRFKGQHELLAAIPKVKEAGFADVRVVIVGADDPRTVPGEGSYSDLLHRVSDELGLRDNVVFTGWRSDVRELMLLSDVYAMPSFEEPFGMVFVEAMFLRRPVLALANGGTVEVVEHERSGLLSPPGDIERLAANLIRLLGDPELRARMGEHGHRRVAEVLNAERMADDVARVYAELVPDR